MVRVRPALSVMLLAFTAGVIGSALALRAVSLAGGPVTGGGAGPDAAGPVLVELFTSEGCSSCPPADALLAELDRSHRETIVLSEHVDYWNRLGWADPFSSARFSERQSFYASRFGLTGVYTPQMVVDGRRETVGSDRGQVLRAVAEATTWPKAVLTLSAGSRHPGPGIMTVPVTVTIDKVPEVSGGERIDALLAVTEGPLRSQVARGENAGRKLDHVAVVRRLQELGRVDPGQGSFRTEVEVRIEPGWNPANLKAVVFIQERGSGRILGAASATLPVASS